MPKTASFKLRIVILLLFVAACKKDQSAGFSFSKYYAVTPDVQSCNAGATSNASKMAALNHLNYIRSLHHLPAVTYNYADDEIVQQSALISAANATLDHHPTPAFECYSPLGAQGSSKSNLGISLSSDVINISDEKNIENWFTEEFSTDIGHRRWLLDPFLKYVAYGRVDGKPKKSSYGFASASSLKVVNDVDADISQLNVDYVAYPFDVYPSILFPKNLFLSFSALYDKRNEWNNSYIKYDNATIEVTTDNGQQLQVTDISFNNENTGLPNSIQWKVKGLQDNVQYTVKIKYIYADINPVNYQYKFKLITY